MNAYILDAEFNIIDVIDDYEYLIWDTAFYKRGFFELKVPISRMESILSGLYVYRSDNSYTGRINTYYIDGMFVNASGSFLESLLDFRVDLLGKEYRSSVESAMFSLVRDNVMQGRTIPMLRLGTNQDGGIIGTYSAFGKSLASYFYTLAETYGLSFNIRFLSDEKVLEFNVVEGLNRTQSQTDNSWCVFSGGFGNVNSEYYETNTDYPNIAYVYGENPSSATNKQRISVVVDDSRGEEKRELFVDAGDMKQEEGVSDNAYRELLRQRGLEKLAEAGRYETVDFVIDPDANMTFGLGDICTYKHMVTGKTYDLRVTEIKETHEKTGVKRNIILGRYNLGVVETIKKGAV